MIYLCIYTYMYMYACSDFKDRTKPPAGCATLRHAVLRALTRTSLLSYYYYLY